LMTARQAAALAAFQRLIHRPSLSGCQPILAGTFPLDLDLKSSDLDIICHASNPIRFASRLTRDFGRCPGFRVRLRNLAGLPTVVARFRCHGFPVEIFAQARPPGQQRAVRHLQVEKKLLRLGGSKLRDCIHILKLAGVKTEPAFARCLKLGGDPYLALLKLAGFSKAELLELPNGID